MQNDPIKDAEKALAEARREMDAARKTYTAKQQRFYQLQNALYKARNTAIRKVEAAGHSTNPVVDAALSRLQSSKRGAMMLGTAIKLASSGNSILISDGASVTITHKTNSEDHSSLPFTNRTARPGQTLFAYTVQGSKAQGLLIGEAQTKNGQITFTRLVLRLESQKEIDLLKP